MLPHFQRKIFVKASEAFEREERKRKSAETQKINEIKGEEAKTFYENVISEPSTSNQKGPKRIKIRIETRNLEDNDREINVKKSDLFKAAEIDEIDFVQKALKIKPELLNALDSFGWTLLMVASKAGSVQVVKCLVALKADLAIKDKAGHDCFSLAANDSIRKLLRPKIVKVPPKPKKSPKKDQSCDICEVEGLTQDQMKSHLTSTVHQLKVHGNNPNPKVHYVIPEANRGFQMMLNSGWESNKGLGPPGKESGKLFPVKTALKRDRHGLGLDKSEKKVTHFEPFDVNSVKKPPKSKEERIERNSTMSKKFELKKKQKERQLEIDFRRDFM